MIMKPYLIPCDGRSLFSGIIYSTACLPPPVFHIAAYVGHPVERLFFWRKKRQTETSWLRRLVIGLVLKFSSSGLVDRTQCDIAIQWMY